MLISLALWTGLRLAELLGLNVGDLSPDGRRIRRRVTLDPATTKEDLPGEVFLGPKLAGKLRGYLVSLPKNQSAMPVLPYLPFMWLNFLPTKGWFQSGRRNKARDENSDISRTIPTFWELRINH